VRNFADIRKSQAAKIPAHAIVAQVRDEEPRRSRK
jgi:hypothetical protein